MAWKYIFLRVGNREVPVIFPMHVVHALFAEAMKDNFIKEMRFACPTLPEESFAKTRAQLEVLSAGACELIVMAAVGSSETLGVNARPDDKDRLNGHPYTGGYIEGDPDKGTEEL